MTANRGRIMILYCMAGFFAGILYTNLISHNYVAALGTFGEYSLKRYLQTDFTDLAYLWYLVKLRITPIVVMAILGMTRFRKALVVIFLVWTGFLCGMLFTSGALEMGVRGIMFCVVSLFPQIALYIIGYAVLLFGLYYYPKVGWDFQKTIVVFLAICIGIALEYYMNPFLVKMFIKTI